MMRRFVFASAILATALVVLAGDGRALSVSELSKRADLIVRGRVESKAVSRDSRQQIVTEVKVAVEEVWKGDAKSGLLTVVQAGGILGERKAVVIGQGSYDIGEEVVGFYVWDRDGKAVTIGLDQGKLSMTNNVVQFGNASLPIASLKSQVLSTLK